MLIIDVEISSDNWSCTLIIDVKISSSDNWICMLIIDVEI